MSTGEGATGNESDGPRVLGEDDLPPCCRKARASAPESEATCHETVVSGWFSKPLSGRYTLCHAWVLTGFRIFVCGDQIE